MNFFNTIAHLFDTPEKKAVAFFDTHKPIFQGVLQWIGKEYTTLDGKDQLVKAIDLVETILKVPPIVEAFTPEVVAHIETLVTAEYDKLFPVSINPA